MWYYSFREAFNIVVIFWIFCGIMLLLIIFTVERDEDAVQRKVMSLSAIYDMQLNHLITSHHITICYRSYMIWLSLKTFSSSQLHSLLYHFISEFNFLPFTLFSCLETSLQILWYLSVQRMNIREWCYIIWIYTI